MTLTERPRTLDPAAILTDEMLARFDARAMGYDRENRFFDEDFEELRASGYLLAAVPVEFGGLGLTLAEVGKLQQRLAYVAPATAVAVNMHHYWVGVAADLRRLGDHRMDWVLEETAAGHVFAAAHAEQGNDAALWASTTSATPVDGGWILDGRKNFGSLSPVWTYFGFHAMDTSDPTQPKVLHGFLPRDASGYRIEQNWDALGMRATASHDTVFDGAFVDARFVPVVSPAGPAGAELFHLCVFAWALLGFANVYTGVARRAYDLTVESSKAKRTMLLPHGRSHHPEVQRAVAEMRMSLEAIDGYLDRVCADWSSGVDHGADWALKIIAAKHFVVTQAWSVVDTAFDAAGGAAVSRRSRIEQIFRDARLGRVHPASRFDVYEIVGKAALGIVDGPDSPRWG
jgi:alkylation response protein AidB-like acyl-CoA dehydrogenase